MLTFIASLEGSLFALGQFLSGSSINVNASDYDIFLESNFGSSLLPKIKQYYHLSILKSTPYPAFYAISTVLGDSSYTCPAYRGLNRAVSKGIPAWAYVFSHSSSCPWYEGRPQEVVKLLGLAHTAEISYMVGNTYNLPGPNGTCNMTDSEVAISSFLANAWTSMAATQRPTSESADSPAYQGPNNTLGITILNSTLAAPINYTRCKLWDQINEFQLGLAEQGTLLGDNATTAGTPSISSAGAAATSTGRGTGGLGAANAGSRVGCGLALVLASVTLMGAIVF